MMSLNQLPDEIIRHILFYLSPLDTLHGVGLTCRHLARLSKEGLLWRFHCIQTFKYWHPSHAFRTLLRLPPPQTDWKRLFVLRYDRNKQISRLLNGILRTQVGRHKRFERITKFGYDAKDFLLEHCDADDSFEDVLARRYFAHAALDAIHRHLAVEQWISLKTMESESDTHNPLELEKSLGAFDMFVLHGQLGDMNDITQCLGALTARFCSTYPQMDEWTTRQKALALNRWIRARNLTGLQNPERDYRNLRNCLIGQALQHEDHESIPIISSAIYCSMAQRIGLDARCNAFPTHIHVVVSPVPGRDLDNKRVDEATQPGKRMYLDPHGNDDEVPEQELRSLLASFGSENSLGAMDPTPTSSTVIRTANNIRHSCEIFLGQQDRDGETDLTRLLHGHGPMNVNACYHASLWAMLILVPTSSPDWEEMFDKFMDQFCRHWPEDVWLVDKYVVPLYRHFATTRRRRIRPSPSDVDDAWRIVRYTQQCDNTPPSVFSRSDKGNEDVPFEVGQVFRHRRYGWVGAITGWTFMGGNPRQREDSDLESGRPPERAYFTYIRSTSAERAVIAEENVELINDPELVLGTPFIYAGKFFKRFDPQTCRFVSNLKEQYPDD
ncbi:unnamed protein product [Clonostachys chloroleuca]|uniref:F-box domain-containing protein n=1 Tax=Clonostachys chloroleuca TaxID=1926264 RepID=A0AA35M9Y5_9HYPO|nr:unnamed protein product [Clonostachys chloroleuca]